MKLDKLTIELEQQLKKDNDELNKPQKGSGMLRQTEVVVDVDKQGNYVKISF